MQSRVIVPVLASLALFASAALAQNAPQPPPPGPEGGPPMHMSHADMAKHHARMCTDGYARAVGHLAALEVKLDLTGKQQPLFDQWKKVKLASAKARANECAAMKMAEMHASIVERMKQKEKMLKLRLADLQAELPALQALANSLSDEQKHVFDRPFMHGPFGHEHMMRGMHGMDGPGHGPGAGPGPGPGPDDEAPPPED